MSNVCRSIMLLILFFALALAGCNPIATKTNVDTAFHPGLDSNIVKKIVGVPVYPTIAPILNQPVSLTGSNTAAIQGSAISQIDFFDTNISGDSGMTYTCVFDRLVDGAVAAGAACSTLPGTLTFSTTEGTIDWTPNSSAFGPYEFKVTGTNSFGSDTKYVVVDVRPAHAATSLIGYWDADFARTNGGQGNNTVLALTDMSGGGVNGTFNNFGSTISSGYDGALPNSSTLEKANPYRLVFDGANDNVTLGTSFNSQSSFYFDTWTSPASSTTAKKVIASNGGTGSTGFTLSQNYSADGKIQLTLGQRSYVDEVLADNPVGFWRLGETTGTTASDVMGVSPGTYMNAPSIGQPHAGWGDQDGSVTLNGTTQYVRIPKTAPLAAITGSGTIEAWFKISAPLNYYAIASTWFNNGADHALQIFICPDGTLCGWFEDSEYHSGVNVNDGLWHQAVIASDGVNGKVYVDGILRNTAAGTFTAMLYDMQIGIQCQNINSTGCSINFPGSIDEVSIYGTALSAARILEHYNAGSRPTCRSRSALANNFWYQLGGLFTSGNTLKLFVNGTEECSITAPATYSGSASALTLGSDTSGSNSYNGAIGDFKLYSTGTAATNSTNYAAGKSRFYEIPEAVSGQLAWMSADTITGLADGASVSAWNDRSVNGFNGTQPTPANQPKYKTGIINGKPVVRFDSTQSQYIDLGTALGKPANFTVFGVFQTSDGTNPQYPFGSFDPPGGNKSPWADMRINGGAAGKLEGSYISNDGAVLWAAPRSTTAVITPNVFYAADSTYTNGNASSNLFLNGSAVTTAVIGTGATANSGPAYPFSIGRPGAYNGAYLAGDVAEMIVYNAAITTTQRQQIEQYLQRKYNLPITNTAPTVTITAPLASNYINNVNQAAFTVSGTCNLGGQTVNISAVGGSTVSSTAVCTGATFSATGLNYSSLSDGAVTITVTHSDPYGYLSAPQTVTLTKNTSAPPNPSGAIAMTTPGNGVNSILTTATLTFAGGITGNTITLFTDSSCTTAVSSAVAFDGAGNASVTTNALTNEGTKNFYYRSANSFGSMSTCTNTSFNYYMVTSPGLNIPSGAAFPSNNAVIGSNTSLDFNNVNNGGDYLMSYTCNYDRLYTASIASGAACTTLPGTVSFNTTTGVLNWTPDATAFGAYDICVNGTNMAGSNLKCTFINVKPNIDSNNLIYYFDAAFARSTGGHGINAPQTTAWTDLIHTLGSFAGTLTNTAGTTSSGWDGTVLIATPKNSPHRAVLNGSDSNDYIDFGTIATTFSSELIDTWVSPANVTQNGRVIASHGDSTGKGISVYQSKQGANTKVSVGLGDKNFVDYVLGLSPLAYYRLGETSGTVANDWGSNATNGVYTGVLTQNSASNIADGDASFYTTAGYVSIASPIKHEAPYSVCAWVKPDAIAGSNYIIANGGESGAAHGFALLKELNTYAFYVTSNTAQTMGVASVAIANTNWAFLCGTWDGTTTANAVKLYVNGVVTTATASGAAINATTRNTKIGLASGGTTPWNGSLDEAMVFGSVISSTDVTNLYNLSTRPFCSSKSYLANGYWYDLSALWNSGTNNLRLYVNGTKECDITVTGQTLNGSANNLRAGIDSTAAAGSAWNGAIADMKIYAAVNTSDPATNYAATKQRFKEIPENVAGLQAWYKADALTGFNDGDPVSSFTDMSGNARHATQATGTKQPVYKSNIVNSQPVLRFDGVDDYMDIPNTVIPYPNGTVFIVMKSLANDGKEFYTVTQSGVSPEVRMYSNGALNIYSNAAYRYSAAPFNQVTYRAGYNILTTMLSSTTASAFQNGTSVLNATALGVTLETSTPTIHQIGGYTANGDYANIDVAEIIIYNASLTASDRQQVEQYLSRKYGVAVP